MRAIKRALTNRRRTTKPRLPWLHLKLNQYLGHIAIRSLSANAGARLPDNKVNVTAAAIPGAAILLYRSSKIVAISWGGSCVSGSSAHNGSQRHLEQQILSVRAMTRHPYREVPPLSLKVITGDDRQGQLPSATTTHCLRPAPTVRMPARNTYSYSAERHAACAAESPPLR